MNALNEGGPAFPSPAEWNENGECVYAGSFGMSIRDWFAGLAMQSRIKALGYHTHEGATKEDAVAKVLLCKAETAKRAYQMADAMIAERESGGSK